MTCKAQFCRNSALMVSDVYKSDYSSLQIVVQLALLSTLDQSTRTHVPVMTERSPNNPILKLELLFLSRGILSVIFCTNYLNTAYTYEGWNFNSGNYLFTTDTK